MLTFYSQLFLLTIFANVYDEISDGKNG